MSLVYYLLDANYQTARVKIGYTTDLTTRLRILTAQTMSRQTPIVLALEEGDITVERKRHAQCSDAWLIGEWFAFGHPVVQALIYEHGDPFAYLAARPHLWHDAGGWASFTGWTPGWTPPGVREGRGDLIEEPAPLTRIEF